MNKRERRAIIEMSTDRLNLCIAKHTIGAITIFVLTFCVFVILGVISSEQVLNVMGIAISIVGYLFCCDLVLRTHWLQKESNRRNYRYETKIHE